MQTHIAPRKRHGGCIASLALLAATFGAPFIASAQTKASTAQPAAAPDDEVLVLSPFDVVVSTKDGYSASNSLIATGFNRDLAHTPLTVNVVTDSFIHDAAMRSYAEINDYLPNTYIVTDPMGLGSTSIARGQSTSYYAQDGNRFYTEPILGAGSRVEFIKGPATLFFGRAQPGGILNFSTRPPSALRQTTLSTSYGSFGLANVDLGSQGTIVKAHGRPLVTYRLDTNFQDGGTFVDYGHDRYQQVRAAVGVQPVQSLSFRFSYEYSWRDQAGTIGTPAVLSPLYYSDYRNPRPEEIAWAQAAGRAGAGATPAQAITFLQNRWRESDNNWGNDVLSVYGGILKPIRRVGIDASQSPYGWDWNYAGTNSYGQKIVYNYGGEATWTANRHIALKLSWYKYDLKRNRLDINVPTLWGDGVFRFNNPNSLVYRNNDNTAAGTVLFNYDIGPTSHTTNIGATRFKDFYTQQNGVYYNLNAAPDVGANDIRMSGGGIVTPGWNPASPYYYDITQYVKTYAAATTPLFSDHNYEDAYYASHIAEFFDHRLGVLLGGRYQKYDNTRFFPTTAAQLPYNVAAKVWTMGVSYQLKPDIVLFASESTSFEPNGGSTVSGSGATPAEQINNPVPPVLGRGHDIGVKFNYSDRLAFSLSYFNLVRDNDFKTTDTDRTNADPRNNDADPNNNVVWYVVGGERLSRGIDFQANYRPTRQWQGLFTVGWLPVAKITQNPLQQIPVKLGDGTMGIDPNVDNAVGLRQANAPMLKVATWNSYRLANGVLRDLTLGAGIVYTSKVALTTNRTTPQYAPAFTTVRIAVSYPFKVYGRLIDAQFAVSNLFDKEFYRSTSRGEPRTFSLNLSSKF